MKTPENWWTHNESFQISGFFHGIWNLWHKGMRTKSMASAIQTVDCFGWACVSRFSLGLSVYLPNLVGGFKHVLFFHILGMSSSHLTFIFFRWVGQPPTRHMLMRRPGFLHHIWRICTMTAMTACHSHGSQSSFTQRRRTAWSKSSRELWGWKKPRRGICASFVEVIEIHTLW